jgi:hypothetical protein
MHAICVDPARVAEVWPLVKDLVKRATDRGFSDFSAIEANVLDGMYLVWLAYEDRPQTAMSSGRLKIKGVAVTGLVGDACEIIAAAGSDIRSWLHLIERIEGYALIEGRKRMRIIGRQGWKRLLPDYKQQAVVLERKL